MKHIHYQVIFLKDKNICEYEEAIPPSVRFITEDDTDNKVILHHNIPKADWAQRITKMYNEFIDIKNTRLNAQTKEEFFSAMLQLVQGAVEYLAEDLQEE